MVDERDAAVGAAERLPAAAAEHDGGGAAAVEVENRLAAVGAARLQGPGQGERERAPVAGAQLLAEVDHLDGRERPAGDALREGDQLQGAGVGPVVRLHPRRGAAQHHRHSGPPAQLEGDVDGVVAGHPVLLVGGGVLLVDDHHPEPRERGKDGAPGADHDIDLAEARPSPFDRALGVGETGVAHRQPPGKARREAPDHLRGQGDLGDQADRLPAEGQGGVDGRQVDLGLAAPGDAEQEHRTVPAGGDGLEERRGRLPLRRRQQGRLEGRALGAGGRQRGGDRARPAAPPGLRSGGAHPPGHHRLDHLGQRRAVPVRDPLGEPDHGLREERLLIQDGGDGPGVGMVGLLQDGDHEAGQGAGTEGDLDPHPRSN